MNASFLKLTCASLFSLAALTACGGGSDGADSPAAESALGKYVGAWVDKCTALGGGMSEHQFYDITQLDDKRLSAVFHSSRYRSGNCSGAGTRDGESTSTLTYVGSKSVPQGVVDMFELAQPGKSPRNNISAVKDGQFFPVGDSDQMAADGFPGVLVTEYVFTKR